MRSPLHRKMTIAHHAKRMDQKIEQKTERTIENLRRNGFSANYFERKEDAVSAILAAVPNGATAGFAGSITIDELGIFQALKDRGTTCHWHWYPAEGEDRKEIMKQAAIADVFFSGINAITEDGTLINIDGTGNRLSGLLFGHDKAILVAGINKIARNYEEGLLRIKNSSCGANAKRLGRKTPCAELGKCMNCNSPDRICKATLLIDRQPGGVPIEIFLIGEKLGY